MFTGNYEQYHRDSQVRENKKSKLTEDERLLLENHLAEVLSRLSVVKSQDEFARLDEEYHRLLAKF